MTTAALISQSLASHGVERKGENAIYAIVMDEHNVHCMTHDMLNTWWEGLSPEEKGVIFDREMSLEDGDVVAVPALQHAGLSALSTAVDTIQTGFADLMGRPFVGLGSIEAAAVGASADAHADGRSLRGGDEPAAAIAGIALRLGQERAALCGGELAHAGMLRASGVDAVEAARG